MTACAARHPLRSLPGLSKKTLTRTLRETKRSGLLTRHIQEAVPPAVEYRMTALGQRLVGLVDPVHAWGRDDADALDQLEPRPPFGR